MNKRSTHHLLVFALLVGLLSLSIAGAAAQEDDDPRVIVDGFYAWYMENSGYDEETETMRNIMVEGIYHDSPYLTADFITELDALMQPESGLHHDPLACAQDVPERIAVQRVDVADDTATALVYEWFGFNARPHSFAVDLVDTDDGWLIDGINCSETMSARGVVEGFYRRYIAFARPEAGEFRNPLLERAYDDTALTQGFIEQLNNLLTQSQPIGGDPVVCAQDIPQGIQADTLYTVEDTTIVLIREYFAGNATPYYLAAEVIEGEAGPQIANVMCEMTPELTAAYFYNQYLMWQRFDMMMNRERQEPLEWWTLPWDRLLDASLLETLRTDGFTVSNPEGRSGYNRLLCAQDLPEQIRPQVIEADESVATLSLLGDFPSGPETMDTRELPAQVTLSKTNGTWQITDVACTTGG